jgi:hypothetical protein
MTNAYLFPGRAGVFVISTGPDSVFLSVTRHSQGTRRESAKLHASPEDTTVQISCSCRFSALL